MAKEIIKKEEKTVRGWEKERYVFQHDKLKNFQISALIATIVAVILLGCTIAFGVKVADQRTDINNLKSQISQLQTTATQNSVRENGVSYTGVNGKTALKLLQKSHKVVTKDYGAMGQMVTSIDGVAADSSHFWAFYVNGTMASEGASTYVTKTGDKIEWKLEAISQY